MAYLEKTIPYVLEEAPGQILPYPATLNVGDDAIECCGLVINDYNGGTPIIDNTTSVTRTGNNLVFADAAHPSGVTLATLLSGGIATTQIEVDFGTTPDLQSKFTITDATVTATSKITAWQDGATATGKPSSDENELDVLQCTCIPAAGSFTLIVTGLTGFLYGKYKIDYQVF